ncbi:MAG: response regulator transcription factor [Dehalococcoidia bacterium]|nr:response regulator transcription factor [Dehalococcoidia bacterium]
MKALVIEDEADIVEAISLIFQLRWPAVEMVSTPLGEEGIQMVESESPNIVLLDINLPDVSGFQVLSEIRRFSDVPVIILTVRGVETDRVKGLELGADDYVVKPFSHLELLARVRAVLRRRGLVEGQEAEPFTAGDFRIDFTSRKVFLHSKEIKLTPIEYQILYHLARSPEQFISSSTLARRIWGEDYPGAAESLKVHMRHLREKIEEDPANPKLILTEHGKGYRLARGGE